MTRFQRLIDQAIDNGIVLAAIAFSLFTILSVLSYAMIQTNENARESSTRAGAAVQCVLHQFTEHRHATASFQRENAEAHDFEFVTSEDLPVKADELKKACRHFFTVADADRIFGPAGTTTPTTEANP